MLETVVLGIVYLLGVIHPQIRYCLYPSQLLLAWTESEGELSVRWSTGLPVSGSLLRYKEYRCGDQLSTQEWKEVDADWTFFYMSGLMFWHSLHTAVMGDLRSDCFYQYQVGSGIFVSETHMVSGRTVSYSHAGTDSTHPVNLVVYGDMGTGFYSESTRSCLKTFIKEENVDGILHLGDIAYNLASSNGMVGDEFLGDLQGGIADETPYMVSPGNHEKLDNFTHYKRRFRMPSTEANQGTNTFYSFNLGSVHMIIYNTELLKYGSPEERQTHDNWLRSDLRQANLTRASVPWIVVAGHKPLYCDVDWARPMEEVGWYHINENCFMETVDLRKVYEDLFYTYQVDLVLAGHVHRYERETAIYKNETVPSEKDTKDLHLNPKAPVHIISGIAGNYMGAAPVSSTPQSWNQVENDIFGFGLLTVFNQTHLLWREFDSSSQTAIDSMWLIKTRETL